MKKTLFFVGLFFLSTLLTNAQMVVYPSDDMTVNSGSSPMFPPSDQLWIANWTPMQNYHQTLMRFDLSEYEGKTANSATLNLYQYFHAPDGSPTPSKIFAITEDWAEGSWDTHTNIAHGENAYATTVFDANMGWFSIDITELVNKWLDGSVENKGLVLIADQGTKFAQFFSKEASNEAQKPYLEMDITIDVDDIANNVDVNVYPNPVSEFGVIKFNTNARQNVEIELYNSVGQLVKQIENKEYNKGSYSVDFSVSDLNAGIYILKIRSNNQVNTQKVIVK